MNTETYPLLSNIGSPADLRELDEDQLPQLADELRRYLIASVATSGGHFGAGLGCVELTVALHFLYDTPHDRIVWDVGHQAYPHKILCERAGRITTIKKHMGLAPFPKREESEYDTFGTGHSSTSISAALGMAVAAALPSSDPSQRAKFGTGESVTNVLRLGSSRTRSSTTCLIRKLPKVMPFNPSWQLEIE